MFAATLTETLVGKGFVRRGMLIALGCLALGHPAAGQGLEILSRDGTGNLIAVDSDTAFTSGNGRWVVFESSALLPQDTTNSQVYLRDRESGALELVSVRADGNSADAGARLPPFPNATAISYDGRFVVFRSTASDLVPGANPSGLDLLYLRDRLAQTTSLVSVSTSGSPANGNVFEFSLAPTQGPEDFAVIAFNSTATNLDPGDTDGTLDTYVHETAVSTTQLACFDVDGDKIAGGCREFSLSCGGGAIAFKTIQNGVAPGDANFFEDVYVGQPLAGNNQLLTRNLADEPNNYTDIHSPPSIDCFGRRVAFATNFSILGAADPFNTPDLYVRDAVSGEVWRIEDEAGTPVGATVPRLSTSGGWLVFEALASLDPIDTNSTLDVYLYEFHSQNPAGLRLVSQNAGAAANQPAGFVTVSDLGHVVFDSAATNLVAGDNNNRRDVFGSGPFALFVDGFERGDVSA